MSLFTTILLTKLTIIALFLFAMNTDIMFEEEHHCKPRSKVVPEPQNQKQNQKHTLPQPEWQVKTKKPEHIRKERRETQENEEKSRLVI